MGAFDKHLQLMQNQRLKRMMEKLKNYNFSVIWTPGKTHHISDELSFAPVFGPSKLHFEPEHLERSLQIFDATLTQMEPSEDARYTETIDFLKTGKHISNLNSSSGAYNFRKVLHQLCIKMYRGEHVLVLDGCRLVIPNICDTRAPARWLQRRRQDVQDSHMQLYYWPNMRKNIEISISSCKP